MASRRILPVFSEVFQDTPHRVLKFDEIHVGFIREVVRIYIDIDKPIVLDAAGEDVIICNSSIKCRQLMIRTPNITLSATDGANMLIVCTEAIDTTKSPAGPPS